jgi:3-methyladenine DNA glycosylase Tag
MIKNRLKIKACVFNAKKLVAISKEYSGFWHFLESQNMEDIVEKLKGNFKFMGYTNAHAFLRYVGLEVIKPDLNVVRVMFRLGLINSDKRNMETYKQI